MLNESDAGKPHLVISTKIARDYANADGSPKTVGQSIKLGPKEFTIVGIYDTGSILVDATLVMDIGTARDLFNLTDAVSTYNVEPTDPAEGDAVAERIEKLVPGVRAKRISQFNQTGRLGHGPTRPVPADGGRPGGGRRWRRHREHDADEHVGTVRRIRGDANQRLDPPQRAGPGDDRECPAGLPLGRAGRAWRRRGLRSSTASSTGSRSTSSRGWSS